MAEVSGTVRSADGSPIEGVLVMGADLNYSETDENGGFRLKHPEMALFFWCAGFFPGAYVLNPGERHIDIVLRPVMLMRASAGGTC